MYHYAANNPVKYTDPDGRAANVFLGAATGGLTGAGANAIGQVVGNLLNQKLSGQKLDLLGAIKDIDWKSVGTAALSGAVSGAITSGVSSIKTIGDIVKVSKTAAAILNSSANMAGATVGTFVDNAVHGEKLTKDLKGNLLTAGGAGIVTGFSSQIGGKVISTDRDGLKTSKVLFITNNRLSETTNSKIETFKDMGISTVSAVVQEINRTIRMHKKNGDFINE